MMGRSRNCQSCDERVGKVDRYCRWCGLSLRDSDRTIFVVCTQYLESHQVIGVYLSQEKADRAVESSMEETDVDGRYYYWKEVSVMDEPEEIEQ